MEATFEVAAPPPNYPTNSANSQSCKLREGRKWASRHAHFVFCTNCPRRNGQERKTIPDKLHYLSISTNVLLTIIHHGYSKWGGSLAIKGYKVRSILSIPHPRIYLSPFLLTHQFTRKWRS